MKETALEREDRLDEEATQKRWNTPCEFPMQPIAMFDGVVRFKPNRIVRWLLDAGTFDMNMIAVLPGITDDERSQFAQLIGYSVSGYGDLSYALDVNEADRKSDSVVADKETK